MPCVLKMWNQMVPLFFILSFFSIVTLLIPNLISFNTSYLIMSEGGHCHCQQALSQTASSALCLCFLDSRWSRSAGGVTSCQPDLQYWFWAPDCNVPPPILSPFINVQHFLGHFVQADYFFFFALQLLYRVRVCVVFNQTYSHHLFMSKWQAPSVDNWLDVILICTCVCDFFFNIYRPEPVQRNSGK